MYDQQADDTELKVLRRTVLKSTAAGAGLAVLGGKAVGQDDEEEEDGAGEDAEYAEVVVSPQVTDGTTVEIESVTLPEGGFVSVVDPVDAHSALPLETMPSLEEVMEVQVQGASEFLEAGTHEDVVLEFDEALEGEKLYQVWVHRDTTGDETFAYVDSVGEEDTRYPAEFEPPEEEDDENGDDENGDDENGDEEENGDDENGDGETRTIELEGVRSGWVGISPDEIEGESNPTLEMEAGATYEVTWVNGDGLGHNFVVIDDEDERLVSTDLMSEQGETQTVEFEATEEMARYFCSPHRGSMNGPIEIVGGGGEGDEENGEDEEEANGDEENGGDKEEEAAGGKEEAEEEEGAEEEEEIHPTQVPNIVMGDVYLHELREDIELPEQEEE